MSYTIVFRIYIETAEMLRATEDYTQSNKYILELLKRSMQPQDYYTLETALKANYNSFHRLLETPDVQAYQEYYPDKISYFVAYPYAYTVPPEIKTMVDTGAINKYALRVYIDNKADLDWEKSFFNTNPGRIANSLLPKNVEELALSVIPLPARGGQASRLAPLIAGGTKVLYKDPTGERIARIAIERTAAIATTTDKNRIDDALAYSPPFVRVAVAETGIEHPTIHTIAHNTGAIGEFQRLVYDLARGKPYGAEPPHTISTRDGRETVDVYNGMRGILRQEAFNNDITAVISKIQSGELTYEKFRELFTTAIYDGKSYYIQFFSHLEREATARTVRDPIPEISPAVIVRNVEIGPYFKESPGGWGTLIKRAAFPGRNSREIFYIDLEKDDALRNFIEQERAKLQGNSDIEATIKTLLGDIRGTMQRNVNAVGRLQEQYRDKPVELGVFIKNGAGVCRHRSALFKATADSLGITSRIVRGSLQGTAHMWNEVKTPKGIFVVDCSEDQVFSLQERPYYYYKPTEILGIKS
ncbi:hypothetical protein HY640_01010 [Candidatus Woesearchaeota archaeon]|nr:hypothetical protein [Candidatus Woesearchaeota archaeon]